VFRSNVLSINCYAIATDVSSVDFSSTSCSVAYRPRIAAAFSVQTMRRAPSSQTLNEFAAVTEEDVARLIKLLPPKTPPLDCLQVSLLKTAVAVMAPSLIRLANLSFAAGVFPSRYKLGHVIPLLKKPGMPKKDSSSYRPITNLCTFSKILEKIVLVRLQPHVRAIEFFPVSLPSGLLDGVCASQGGW